MFLDLCSPPLPPVSPYYHTDLLLQHFSHTICFLLFSVCLCIIFIIFSHHSFKLSLQTCPLTAHALPFTLSYCLCCLCFLCCDAVCASGTTASSHLKHFRETHICYFRAQRDMPWQRPFEVASQGEPEPERGI